MIGNSILRASVLTLFIAQSQAATLEFQGAASVDNGSGFSPALHYMLLNGGDRVRALKGCAKIIYDNGYCAKVCDGQMAIVFSTPPEYIDRCTPQGASALSSAAPEYVINGSLDNTSAVSPSPPQYAGGGSLKDTPAEMGSPHTPDGDLLPAGLLLAAGGGMALAIGTAEDNGMANAIAKAGDSSRAASP